ncbi:molybdate ABC transporter substrate-binding protein [Polycladidibacter stylochi]|uniref:molybdate ABC transporter substrate-binding protein n=1 Tax=Polycladidibacter stylochi TaxID=1807766 RepID=UPI000835560C|nr:molybdate ABC transporter substrate-binding protein [Pseudovibrio stylochi]
MKEITLRYPNFYYKLKKMIKLFSILFSLVYFTNASYADDLQIAVAANFQQTAKEVGKVFEAETGHTIKFSFGSTGTLYNQVSQGAPFDIFLAADMKRPKMAVENGFGIEGSVTAYAQGRLALYSSDDSISPSVETLKNGGFGKLAIANPKTAPYGQAAKQALDELKLWKNVEPFLVQGNSIGQTFQFVATGNAPIGFVAFSQIAQKPQSSYWLVPGNLYQPINQGAVLLKNSQGKIAALMFMQFLQSDQAVSIIENYGYKRPL